MPRSRHYNINHLTGPGAFMRVPKSCILKELYFFHHVVQSCPRKFTACITDCILMDLIFDHCQYVTKSIKNLSSDVHLLIKMSPEHEFFFILFYCLVTVHSEIARVSQNVIKVCDKSSPIGHKCNTPGRRQYTMTTYR